MKKLLLCLLFISFCAFTYAQYKIPISGLVCRDFGRIKTGDEDIMKQMGGVVVQLYWRDIQPDENGAVKRNNDADAAINWVRDFKIKYGVDLGIKIRLYCGIYSPVWLFKKVGFVSLDQKQEKIPKFWTGDYVKAFADVQAKLAAMYDDVPEVREVVDGCTGSTTAEAFIRPFAERRTDAVQAFLQAGYTTEADEQAIKKSFNAMKVWKKTLVSVCFSNFKKLNSDGSVDEDINRTIDFVNDFINEFGKQAVVGNNGLRPESGHHGQRWQEGGDMYALANYFKKLHDSKSIKIYFQTAKDERIGNLQNAIEDGVTYGASYIELPGAPRNYTQDIPLAQMFDMNKKLQANAKH
jgi:hypothetical protein